MVWQFLQRLVTLGFIGSLSSKVISHSLIVRTKSLETSDRGALTAQMTSSRTFLCHCCHLWRLFSVRPPLGQAEAASRCNYTPLLAPLSLCPDRLQQNVNSLCVIFVMIHPSVHMDTALLYLPAHKHSAWPLLLSTHYTVLNLNLWTQICACGFV